MKASDYILGCDVLGIDGVAVGAGPYVASDPNSLLGRAWPSPEGAHPGQCVSLVRAATGAPHSSEWSPGDSVKGNSDIQPGTAIATFEDGNYKNKTDGTSHAALYMSQDDGGIYVVDQWTGQPAHARYVRFGGGASKPVNDGDAFSVVLGLGRNVTVGSAWFSGSDEAHAGIRAVRTLQGVYAEAVKKDPSAVKYKAQVDPLVTAADKWDDAIVFYVNDDAVQLGRRAQVMSQQIAAEYDLPPIVLDPALAQGSVEAATAAVTKAAKGAGDAAASALSWLPWVAGGAALLAGGVFLFPVVAPLFAKRAVGRLAGARR